VRATLLTSQPTTALPGSAEKIAVLCARASRREPLFVTGDRQMGVERADLEPGGFPPGVTPDLHHGRPRYQARLSTGGKRRHLGWFGTIEEASLAVEAARRLA